MFGNIYFDVGGGFFEKIKKWNCKNTFHVLKSLPYAMMETQELILHFEREDKLFMQEKCISCYYQE